MKKATFLLGILVFSLLVSLNLIASLDANFTIESSTTINRTENGLINVSVGAENMNITEIVFSITGRMADGVFFVGGTNGTSAPDIDVRFINTTSEGNVKFIFRNETVDGIVANQSIEEFWFQINPLLAGNLEIQVTANGTDGTSFSFNTTLLQFTVNFAFSGYVKNETGGNQGNANVSIYQFVESQNGPPQEILEASTTTDANGYFSFDSINGSAESYVLKIIYYNASGVAEKVGSALPPFPADVFYPVPGFENMPEYMKPPTLNGTKFYLQEAATLRLNATNGTDGQKFGYMVLDQKVGFPIASNMMSTVDTVDIVVPVGKNYTVMFMRDFMQFNFNPQWCDGTFMNDTDCPAPPISNSSLGTLTKGQILQVTQNLAVSEVRLTGCIKVAQGHDLTALNVTNIIPKLMPWEGFVPPVEADIGKINVSSQEQLNMSNSSGWAISGDVSCPNSIAAYNISVIGSNSGIPYLIEFYAKNASSEADLSNYYVAAFQNVTITNTSEQQLNVTMYKLVGDNWSGSWGTLNTSTMRVNIQNSSGDGITTKMHVDVEVKHPIFGKVDYIIETITNGTFYLPILNNTNWAKVKIFANDAPPKEAMLNLSLAENNITLVTMTEGDAGFKRINESGEMEMVNVSELQIEMRFLRNTASCNVINPSSSCEITSMNASDFNPFKALVAGKVNMEMKIISTNVTLRFMNFDMFSAKQPPMDSIINENASSINKTVQQQTWEFGSFVPRDVYDYVLIGMPYSDNSGDSNYLNESWIFNITIPLLYDEEWEVVWNRSRGDSYNNLTDDFLDYNSSTYRSYLTSAGVECSTTDSSFNSTPCYMDNSSNIIWIKIPHFSGVAPNAFGVAPSGESSGDSSSSSSSSSSSGGGATSTGSTTQAFWTNTYIVEDSKFTSAEGYTKELSKKQRVKIKINNEDHYVGVIEVTSDTAIINVSSTPQQAILSIGDEKKFDVTDDGYYNIYVKLNSVENSKANLTIKKIYEKIPEITENQTAEKSSETSSTETAESETTGETKSSLLRKILKWSVIIIPLIAIIGGVVYYLLKKKRFKIYGY